MPQQKPSTPADDTAASSAATASPVGPQPRVGLQIVWLLLAALGLAILLFGALAWQQGREVYDASSRYARNSARLLEEHAARVFAIHAEELRGIEFMLNALGWDAATATPQLHEHLRAAVSRNPEVDSYWIIGRDGIARLNSFTYPAPALDLGDRDYVRVHLDAERPVYIGPRLQGRLDGRIFIPISMRLHDRDGGLAGVAHVSLVPDYFRTFYRSVLTQPSSQVLLLHEDGTVLVREPDPAAPAPLDLGRHPELVTTPADAEGLFRLVSPLDGVERLMARRKVGDLPLYVLFGVGTDRLDAEVGRRRLAYAAFAAVAALVISGLAAVALLRSQQLERAHRGLRAAHADLEERIAQRTRHLDEALAEREVLIRDIHHRVKNNLQVVASLLQLQAASEPSMRPHFDEALRRVDAMGVLHELVYRNSAVGLVRLDDAVERLCRRLDEVYQGGRGPVRLAVEADPVEIDVERCGQIMLVLNEIVSNAFKYAYPGGVGGEVRVELRRYGSSIDLMVADSGVGMPETPAPAAAGPGAARPGSVGLKLVEAFALHLGARYSFGRQGGTVFRMVVPLDDAEEET